MRKACTILALALVVGCGGSEPPPVPYAVQGEGPIALVFIHGWACDRGHWSNPIDHFSREHTVVTLDLPGDAASGTERAEDVKGLIESLGLERVVLVGHSMGGPVALETARLIPERVLGIVGVDTQHNAESSPDPAQANARGYDALIMEGTRPDEFNRMLAEVVEELTGA